MAAAAGGRGREGGGPAAPVSPSPPTKEGLPWPTHAPCRPRGRSGVFQATWGALSSDRLFSSHSGRRSPSGAVYMPPRVSAPEGVSLPLCPHWGYPRGSLARGVLRHCPSALGSCLGFHARPLPLRLALCVSLAQVSNALAPAPLASLCGSLPLESLPPHPIPRGREAPPETGAEAAGPDASHANPPPNTHTLPRDPRCPGTLLPSPSPLKVRAGSSGVWRRTGQAGGQTDPNGGDTRPSPEATRPWDTLP